MSQNFFNELPLRFGTPEDFARVESLLRGEGYDEATLCRALKIKEMSDLDSVDTSKADLSGVSERLAFLIRFFLFVETMPRFHVEHMLDPETFGTLAALDLLRVAEFDPNRCYSPVFLYPVAGLLIASDRRTSPDGGWTGEPPDIVFPAIHGGTIVFLNVISRAPTGDALDLGSGSGVAALSLSRHVRRAVASDINARATHFARFNAMLNRCPNVEAVCGDMYEAVEGQTFDRIVSHPPYVPALGDGIVYREGGATGEALVRRVVEGLPRHLREGGTFYGVCLGHETASAKFEERVRGWLGESQVEFDLVFALGDEKSVRQFVTEIAIKKGVENFSAQPLERALEEAGAERFVYGALVIHRRAATACGEPWTVRRELMPSTNGESFDRAFRWHRVSAHPDFLEALAGLKPRLSPHMRLHVTHAVRDGGLLPAEFVLDTERPFSNKTKVDQWIVPLIASFDGSRTHAELYAAARAAQAIPEQFDLNSFLKFSATLIERGYLEIDETGFADEN